MNTSDRVDLAGRRGAADRRRGPGSIITLSDNCLPAFLDAFDWVEVQAGSTCYPWQTTPREYLEFAVADITGADPRSRINAIGNAKRAIHAHVDFLLHNCGRCLKESQFPVKLQMLEKLGVIAPAILTKYNRLRNLIEHEYVSPTQEQATEVVDVARLFIEATRSYTRPLPSALHFRTRDGKQACSVMCNWDERMLIVTAIPTPSDSCSACVILADCDPEVWTSWVARILRVIQNEEDPYVKCEEKLAL